MDDQSKEDNKKPASPISDDSKLLMITFAATLGANIVTVVIVGLTIAIAHAVGPGLKHPASNATLTSAPFTICSIIMFLLLVVGQSCIGISMFSHQSDRKRKQYARIGWIAMSVFLTVILGAGLFLMLYWIGIAAGIK
jgi:Na+/proline symporter